MMHIPSHWMYNTHVLDGTFCQRTDDPTGSQFHPGILVATCDEYSSLPIKYANLNL